MGFLSFLLLVAIAYLLWRISDQMPDVLFRLSEIQRDIAELRRRGETKTLRATLTRTPSGMTHMARQNLRRRLRRSGRIIRRPARTSTSE